MPITIQELNENLKTLPEELYPEVNDFVDLLKGKKEIPEWQKETVRERFKKFRENPTQTKEFSQVVAEMREKYSQS